MPVPQTITFGPSATAGRKSEASKRSLSDFLAPLEKIASQSHNLTATHPAPLKVGGEIYQLPRYVFVGPQGGDTPIHIGIFAGIHGDEPEGAYAVVQFAKIGRAHV